MKKRIKRTKKYLGRQNPSVQEIVRMDINDILSHPENPREHNENNIQMIMTSYKEFGEIGPIVIWSKNNYVIAGNGRLEASKRLNMREINVVRADHLTEDQAKAFLIMDNKTTDSSKWNKNQLTELINGLLTQNINLETIGFSQMEIEPLMRAGAPEEFPTFDENLETEHVCPKCGYEWSGKIK